MRMSTNGYTGGGRCHLPVTLRPHPFGMALGDPLVNDPSREVTAAEIADLLAQVDQGAWRLGLSRDDVLDVQDISAATGIEPDRVRELLQGAEPQQPPRDSEARTVFFRSLLAQRLAFVRNRLPKTSPKDDSLRAIGSETDLSYTQVDHLIKGRRSARVEHITSLERHYRLEHGFLSKPEGEALADRLRKIVNEGLPAAAVIEGLRELGAGQVALRSTGSDMPPSIKDLVPVIDALVARTRAQQRRNRPDDGASGSD